MSLGAGIGIGMGAGMGAGMGSGIAIGIASGQENARKKIQQYSEMHEMTVCDKAGKPVPWDQFLQEALSCRTSSSAVGWIIALVVGVLLAAVAGGLVLWMLWA